MNFVLWLGLVCASDFLSNRNESSMAMRYYQYPGRHPRSSQTWLQRFLGPLCEVYVYVIRRESVVFKCVCLQSDEMMKERVADRGWVGTFILFLFFLFFSLLFYCFFDKAGPVGQSAHENQSGGGLAKFCPIDLIHSLSFISVACETVIVA